MLIISEEEVEHLLDPAELRATLSSALIEFSSGRVTQPLRALLSIEKFNGRFGVMPAVYDDVIGTKLVSVFPGNSERGLHTHNAVIQLFRADTGEPLAVVGGRIITALRTAAVSALATQELSAPHAGTLAILGSGVQARSHLAALQRVRSFKDVRVWSRTPENAQRFATETGTRAVATAEEAVRGAAVVTTVTNSPTPILRAEWLEPDAHVNAVGSVGPRFLEIDPEAMRRASVFVESRESALVEAGEIIQSGAAIYAELGEILSGARAKPANGLTIYKSLGIAVEDVAAAKLVVDKKSKSPSTDSALGNARPDIR